MMNGFRRYSKLLLKEALKVGWSTDQHLSKESLEVWTNHIYNLPGPQSFSRSLSTAEIIFCNVFYGFFEISESYDRLNDFSIYLRQFQYRGLRITEARYLRYTVENYLNEMYIFQERLLAYTKRIWRYVEKKDQSAQTRTIIDRVENQIKSTLQPIVNMRGAHTHKSRYTNDDFRRLETLELLVFHGRMVQLQRLYRAEISRIRKEWQETIKTNNREINKLLDLYFEAISPFVLGPKVYLVGKRTGL